MLNSWSKFSTFEPIQRTSVTLQIVVFQPFFGKWLFFAEMLVFTLKKDMRCPFCGRYIVVITWDRAKTIALVNQKYIFTSTYLGIWKTFWNIHDQRTCLVKFCLVWQIVRKSSIARIGKQLKRRLRCSEAISESLAFELSKLDHFLRK